MINFAITRVKEAKTNNELCSMLSREEPDEVLDKDVCVPDTSPWRLNTAQVGSLSRYMGFEKTNTIQCFFLEEM